MKKFFKIILTFIKVRYFSKWTSRDKLLKYQEKQVEKHLKFLKENSPYFKIHQITEEYGQVLSLLRCYLKIIFLDIE